MNTTYLPGVYICVIDYFKDSYYVFILLYLFLLCFYLAQFFLYLDVPKLVHFV